LEKAEVNFCKSVFQKLVNLAAFICITCFIANISPPIRNSVRSQEQIKSNISKADSPIILLYATITEVQGTNSSVIIESEMKTEDEPKRPEKVQTIQENAPTQKSDKSEQNADNNTNNTESDIKNKTKTDTKEPEEWESIEMRVTAYCPCPICCGEYADGITACGHEMQPGDTFVAADKRFPFGTEMLVPGYSNSKPVKVLDRGGAIKGNRLDVFFATHQEALEWGVQYLTVNVRRKSP
jgi:3D (Asp-Asp-Asp) domain-containing protein